MGVIKGERELKKLPKGSLVKKRIKGRDYYYLLMREAGKVKFVYKGKASAGEIKRYAEVKALRARYRNLLSKAKKQVKFLRSSLRGKEPV
jgi:hypothetical protein